MATSSYKYNEDLAKSIKRIVKKFPDNFSHIDPKRVLPLVSDRSSDRGPIAEVRKIPAWLYDTIPYRVAMIAYSEKYDDLAPAVKRLVVVHELEHIGPHATDPEDYRLRRHTVEDWVEMVHYLGAGWTQRADIDIMKLPGEDWKAALASAAKAGRPEKKRKKRR